MPEEYRRNRMLKAYKRTPTMHWIVREPTPVTWTLYSSLEDTTSGYNQWVENRYYLDYPIDPILRLYETYNLPTLRAPRLIADWDVTVEPTVDVPGVGHPYYDVIFSFNQSATPIDDGYGNKPYLQNDYSDTWVQCYEGLYAGETANISGTQRVAHTGGVDLKYTGHIQSQIWLPQLLATPAPSAEYKAVRLYMSINVSSNEGVHWGTMSSNLHLLGITGHFHVRTIA